MNTDLARTIKCQYWLVKSEPAEYSFDDLLKEGKCAWDGVRNYQARNFLRAMKNGDQVFFYHSNVGLEIVGIAKVAQEFFPDPTSNDPKWVSVKLAPVKKLANPVPLQKIKTAPQLKNILLVRQSRLSVMPLAPEEFRFILKISNGPLVSR